MEPGPEALAALSWAEPHCVLTTQAFPPGTAADGNPAAVSEAGKAWRTHTEPLRCQGPLQVVTGCGGGELDLGKCLHLQNQTELDLLCQFEVN